LSGPKPKNSRTFLAFLIGFRSR